MDAKATLAMSDMLCAVLFQALDSRRDFLYIWEREALECLAESKHPMNMWTRARLEQFKIGESTLTHWMNTVIHSRTVNLKVVK